MLTRKTFVTVAAAIAACARTVIALRLADAFARENCRFDRARFLAACNVTV